jgi:hypothetical protein
MDEDDIRDYLTELEDAGYMISVNFGFEENRNLSRTNYYTESIRGRNMKPAICIEIGSSPNKENNENITTCLTSFVKRVSQKFKTIELFDNSGPISLEYVRIKNGIYIDSELSGKIEDELEIEGNLQIHLFWYKDVYLTDKMVFNYYGFNQDMVKFTDSGVANLEFPRDVISGWIVDKNSSFKEVIDDIDFEFDVWYDRSDYYPEHTSFFEYYLSNENIKSLLELCFKDFESIKEEYSDDDFINQYDTKEQLISDILKPKNRWDREYNELGEFLVKSEIGGNIYDEIRTEYADWSFNSKTESDYKEIFKEFDSEVEDQLKTSIIGKINKDEEKTIRLKDGTFKKISYTRPYYILEFNIDWVTDYDSNDLFGVDIEDHMCDYSYHCVSKIKLDPNFSSYDDVDIKAFNDEIAKWLKKEIEK